MSRRAGADGGEQRSDRDYTFGHALLTTENIQKLADQASYWAVVKNFDNSEEVPNHGLFSRDNIMNLWDQGRLTRATLLAGFKTTRTPKRPVPACFFRTLDFLLQYSAAGNSYRAINDKEEAKGFPPAAWCRPPVVTAREEAEAMIQAALGPDVASELQRASATDPIRLFYACRSWCFIHSYGITARLTIGVPSPDVYRLYREGGLSEYLPMLGLVEDAPPANTWAPPCVMMPLGALLYMHEHGRPYLPLNLQELREIRNNGVMSVAVRPQARPLPLPAGVSPAAEPAAATPPGMEQSPALAAAPTATAAVRGGGAGGGGGGGGRQQGRADASTASVAGSRQAGGAAMVTAAAAPVAGGAAAAAGSTAPTARSGGAGASNGTAEAAAQRPADSVPDPVLSSSNWIMPKPFDTPIPPPPPESSDAPATFVSNPAAAVAAAAAAATNGRTDGDGTPAPAAATDTSAPASVAATPTAQQPSPFLQCNDGVQSSYETPALRLFLGERGQSGLSGNWWYVDPETNAIKGPYSPEAMLLSCITSCREIHDETLVCGTEADVKLPMVPPTAAFLPLGGLLRDVMVGSYALVNRVEIVSPLARSFLGNRIRQPKPERPAAAPSSTPVVIAVQASAQTAAAAAPTAPPPQQPPQQPQLHSQPPQLQLPLQQQQPAVAPVLSPPAQPPFSPTPPLQQQQQPPQPQLQPPPPAQQHTVYPLLQPPQPQQQQTQQPQQPPHQLPQQPQQPQPMFVAPGAPPHGAMRGLPLPHLMAGGARPRPIASAGMPVPAYTLPGSMVYMPQYGSAVPYGGQVVMAQPVLVNAQMQQHAPPPQMGQAHYQ